MLAKVLSWWGSRLGGSAPITASRTPPRRGVSAACAMPGRGATSDPSKGAPSEPSSTTRSRTEANEGRRRGAVMGHLPHGPDVEGRGRDVPAVEDVDGDLVFEAFAIPRAT